MKQNYPPPYHFLKALLWVLLLTSANWVHAQLPMQCGVVSSSSSNPAPAFKVDPNTGPTATSCSGIQNIRVNVHFLQHDDGTGNFNATDDGKPGNPSTANTGYDYAQGLMYAMNGQMDQNPVLQLVPGNALTPVPKRVRWVLDGVYFDRSSVYRDGANANGSPAHDYASLCIRADSVINIFLVEEVLWPYANTGISVGNTAIRGYVLDEYHQARCDTYPAPTKLWAVVSSPWTQYVLANAQPWQYASAVNHELCHVLGLNHPFQYNGFSWGECPDAAMNANCWNLNSPAGPNCNTPEKVSNNLMDTNAQQTALAACQIDIIQTNLSTCLADRYVYKCSDCLPPTATFDVSVVSGCMPVPIWLDSRAAVNYDWYKLEIDQVTASGRLVAGTHYESTVYNGAPAFPLGRTRLDAVYAFGPGSTYRVKWATHNYCPLPIAALQVRTFTTPPCSIEPAPGQARSAAPAGGSISPSSPQ